MDGYLGEENVSDLKGTPFQGWSEKEWALHYICQYGEIDGSHHKDWVMDQVCRILLGTQVNVTLAKWSNGKEEYRFKTEKPPSQEYLEFVDNCEEWEEGMAP